MKLNNYHSKLATIILFALSPSYVLAQEVGIADMVIVKTTMDKTIPQISSRCMDLKWQVYSSDQMSVTCKIPMGIMQSALTNVAIGNSYSTPPERFVRFSAAQIGEHVRVQASSWVQTQMPFGQIRKQDTDIRKDGNWFLQTLGGQYPIGTTFRNVAYLGISEQWLKGESDCSSQYKKNICLKIIKVFEETPAKKIGIVDADKIVEINYKPFKSEQDFVKALEKQKIGEKMTLRILRGSEFIDFEMNAEERPPVKELTIP